MARINAHIDKIYIVCYNRAWENVYEKLIVLVLAACVVFVSASFMSGCSKSPGMEAIRAKFEENNYELSTWSENAIRVINAVDAFNAHDEDGFITIQVVQLKDKEAAETFVKDFTADYTISVKKKVYVCIISPNALISYSNMEADKQAALDLFNSCF